MRHFEPRFGGAAISKLGQWLPIALLSVCACSSGGTGTGAAASGVAGLSAPPLANQVANQVANQAGQAGSLPALSTSMAAGSAGLAGGAGAVASAGTGAAASGGVGAAGVAANSAGYAGSAAAGSGGAQAGSAPLAGAGGVTGSAGSAGAATDECGAIPVGRQEPAKPKAVVMHALVEYHTTDANQFVGVRAVLIVPAKPPPSGVIFVWPGTQTFPTGPTVQPVGEGVLQPVLTWGQSCVPGALPGHSTWWISPVYVNDATSIPELSGCHGGPVITVDVGDRLDLDMRLDGTTWNQTVVDLNSKKSTKFPIDLRGQLQQRTLFEIELKTGAKPTEDIIFEHIVLTMQNAEPGACALNNRGMTDYATNSRVSADGLHCCIDRIVLRADGVPATTQDP